MEIQILIDWINQSARSSILRKLVGAVDVEPSDGKQTSRDRRVAKFENRPSRHMFEMT
jgi:hypothetical protein